jgi:hypothetical protein
MMGNTSLSKVSRAFESASYVEDFPEKILMISKIQDMLMFLMDFDFGDVFSEPVNQHILPDYCTVVDCPMDLGTINSNILSGSYRRRSSRIMKDPNFVKEGATQLDVVILEILKDIERVWHNCFLYNFEGRFLILFFTAFHCSNFSNSISPFTTQI